MSTLERPARSTLAQLAAERSAQLAKNVTEVELLHEAFKNAQSIDDAAEALGMVTNSLRQALRKHRLSPVRNVEYRLEKY